MFDIGFSELVLLMLVGLVVLGPKRLPVAIRTVMGWVKTIRGLAANVQNELKQELKLQELQDSIKKAESLNLQTLSPELSKTVEELKAQADKMKSELEAKGHKIAMHNGFSDAFGGGQAVMRDYATGVNYGASDPRKDGAAIPELAIKNWQQ